MHINLVGVLAPTERRLRPQFLVKVVFAQIKLNNRRAVFNGRADESVLVPLCDSRLKLHLHGNCHPIPFVTIDLPVDKPTVSFGITYAVVCTYGYDDGRIWRTRCAVIA